MAWLQLAVAEAASSGGSTRLPKETVLTRAPELEPADAEQALRRPHCMSSQHKLWVFSGERVVSTFLCCSRALRCPAVFVFRSTRRSCLNSPRACATRREGPPPQKYLYTLTQSHRSGVCFSSGTLLSHAPLYFCVHAYQRPRAYRVLSSSTGEY